jgi:hypothetical protein
MTSAISISLYISHYLYYSHELPTCKYFFSANLEFLETKSNDIGQAPKRGYERTIIAHWSQEQRFHGCSGAERESFFFILEWRKPKIFYFIIDIRVPACYYICRMTHILSKGSFSPTKKIKRLFTILLPKVSFSCLKILKRW